MSKNALYGKNWTPVFARIRPGFATRAFFERHETVSLFSPTPPQKNEHKETDSSTTCYRLIPYRELSLQLKYEKQQEKNCSLKLST